MMLEWGCTVNIDNEFRKYLDKLIEYTGIDNNEVFDECYNLNNSNTLSADNLLKIAQNLKVDPVRLWQRQLDFEVLKSNHQGKIILPPCYAEVCTSKIISLQNVLEQFKRYDLYEYILKKLQIDESNFLTNEAVSILAINDAFSFSSSFFTEKDYDAIVARNAGFAFDNILKKEVSMNLSKVKKTEKLIELVCFFEQNWNYQILRSDFNSITIETRESDGMRSSKTYRPFTNQITTSGRIKFVKQVLQLMGVQTYGVTTNSEWENDEKKFSFTVNLH